MHGVAVVTLCCIILPLIAVWPWGGWGMQYDGPELSRPDRVRVVSVTPNGVAERAGIQVGDDVLTFNNVGIAAYYRRPKSSSLCKRLSH